MLNSNGNQARGSNLLGVGQYNERLVLQLIRRAGSLPKAEIARMTQLSAQTVSVIINRLLKTKLLHKRPLQRTKGRVGQPAMPIALNPEGAFSIGVKIGRSSLDILIIDFVGKVLKRVSHDYEYPDPDAIFELIGTDINTLIDGMSETRKKRIVGIGAAAPFYLDGWPELVGAPQAIVQQWKDIDIRQRISDSQELPVWFANDATAACVAELEFGNQIQLKDFLYVFIGTFIGGGIVQNGTLNVGSSGHAGAIGSMLVPAVYSAETPISGQSSVQLIRCASRYLLNNRLKQAGFNPDLILEEIGRGDASKAPAEAVQIFEVWLRQATEAIAMTVSISISVIDFRGIVIDGLLPNSLVQRVVSSVEKKLMSKNMEGLIRPQLLAGSLGNDARAIGGAVLPFYHNFTPDMNVLLNISGAKHV